MGAIRKRRPMKLNSADLSEREGRARQPVEATKSDFPQLERGWATGPILRKMLNITPVTLWRWRHRKKLGFPAAKSINGRLFFPWHEVAAWIDKQPDAP